MPIFDDDGDRRQFVETIAEAAIRYEIRPYAACLMDNHYHLVFDTPRGNLSDAMRHINGVYTQTSNRRHGRTGHVFEGRFRSIVIQRESYLRRVGRYVVLNPVRAGLVREASESPWSTYRATAGLEPPPSWLFLDWLEWAFAVQSRAEAQLKYRLYVNAAVVKKSRLDLHAPVMGRPAFEAAVLEAARARNADRLLPRSYRALSRPTLETLFAAAKRRTADRDRLVERDHLIHTAHVTHGYRLAEIAVFLEVDPSTAGKALHRVAGLRAEPSRHR